MRARPKLRGTKLDLHPALCPVRVMHLKMLFLILKSLLQRGSMGDLLDLKLYPAVCPYRVTRLKIYPFFLKSSLCLLQRAGSGSVCLLAELKQENPLVSCSVWVCNDTEEGKQR